MYNKTMEYNSRETAPELLGCLEKVRLVVVGKVGEESRSGQGEIHLKGDLLVWGHTIFST